MKVKELIEELSKHDPEMLVVLECQFYGLHEGYDPVTKLETLTIREAIKPYTLGKFVEHRAWMHAEDSQDALIIVNDRRTQ